MQPFKDIHVACALFAVLMHRFYANFNHVPNTHLLMRRTLIPTLFLSLLLGACDKADDDSDREFNYTFEKGTEGWTSYFSDYHVEGEDFYELDFKYTSLPLPLDTSRKAIMITGHNHSDDLICMVYRKMEGLQPNRIYAVTFNVDLASNTPSNSFGIGGSPDIAIGAGGLSFAPSSRIDEEGLYRPNFTSQLQSKESNDTLKVLGTIGVGEDVHVFTMINRNNLNNPVNIAANDKGEMWLMIGTDSGYEGITTLYYTSIKIKMK